MTIKRILLITNSYPAADSKEKPFVLPELRALLVAGHVVTLLPIYLPGEIDPDLPMGVKVESRLARNLLPASLILALTCLPFRGFFWKELWSSSLRIFFDFGYFIRFITDSLRITACLRLGAWLGKFDIIYTYWFTGEMLGVLFSPDVRGKCISRAHGHDLYLERECNRGYLPYRESVIGRLDALVLLGEEPKSYLTGHYPHVASRMVISPLGVPTRDVMNPLPDNDTIRLVSCSYPKAVKRLPLIGRLVSVLAERYPTKTVYWTHFGCSSNDVRMPEACRQQANVRLDFRGEVTNEEVNEYYRSQPAHFFVNLSESEGMPVSIMEAMSFGIPIIATSVGGVPQMLDSDCAVLVEKGENIENLASMLGSRLADHANYLLMRTAAQRKQSQEFDAQKNHVKFAAWLAEL